MGHEQRTRVRDELELIAVVSGVNEIVTAVRRFIIRREPQQCRPANARRDDGVVMKVEFALAINGFIAAVAAVVDDLPVAGTVGFDQDVAVNERAAISRVLLERDTVLGIDEVELAVAALDPIVADHRAGRPILEVVAEAAHAQRAVSVVLKGDARGRRVAVVLVDAADVAVVEDVVALDEHVARSRGNEQAVATIAHCTIADRDVIALLDIDRRRVVGITLPCTRIIGEAVGWATAANLKTIKDDVGRRRVGRNVGATNLDHATRFVPIVEGKPGRGPIAVNHRQLAVGSGHALNRDRLCRGALPANDPLAQVGRRAPVDANGVTGKQ